MRRELKLSDEEREDGIKIIRQDLSEEFGKTLKKVQIECIQKKFL